VKQHKIHVRTDPEVIRELVKILVDKVALDDTLLSLDDVLEQQGFDSLLNDLFHERS